MTKKNDEKWEMKIVWKDPKKLKAYVNNAKKHPPEQVKDIANQIHHFGWDQPITLHEGDVIIKGHGRRLAALELNLPLVPCVEKYHLTEAQAQAERLADNKVAESEWDMDILRFELGTIERVGDVDMNLTGFNEKHIGKILDDEPVVRSKPKDDDSEGSEDSEGNLPEDVARAAEGQNLVVVECETEESMQELFERLKGENWNVRIIA